MNQSLKIAYICFGMLVCGWFTVAAANGWRAVNLGILDGSSSGGSGGGYGRSYGGSWGGGK